MKYLMMVLLFVSVNLSQIKEDKTMEVSNKQKVAELLKSIETGDHHPVSYINPEKYIQHNPMAADGLAGFGELMSQLPEGSAKADVIRVFEDGEYVFSHTKYNFFGPKAAFDIFRFENGKIVEHWDNIQEIIEKTASGRTMFDGPTEVVDKEKTEVNKTLIANFIKDILMGQAPDKITNYISTEKYHQHNPGVKDGLEGLGEALKSFAEAGLKFEYHKNHIILGEGNFVLSVSEGIFGSDNVSFYDLFRIEEGKIVEHWDVIEKLTPAETHKNKNGKFNF